MGAFVLFYRSAGQVRKKAAQVVITGTECR